MKVNRTNIKQKRQMEFIRQHTMTKEDQEKMIREKFERARAYSEAFTKREELLSRFR